MKKALFLDRDGVINEDIGYLYQINKTRFIPGIFDLVSTATNRDYHVCVVTNQAGIARGLYTEKDFWELMNWMKLQFEGRGSKLDSVYFCPFHLEAIIVKYRQNSFDRKPNPGMILKAQKDWNLDLSNSIFVGDNYSDIQAGLKAGIAKNFLFDPNGQKINSLEYSVVSSLLELLNEL